MFSRRKMLSMLPLGALTLLPRKLVAGTGYSMLNHRVLGKFIGVSMTQSYDFEALFEHPAHFRKVKFPVECTLILDYEWGQAEYVAFNVSLDAMKQIMHHPELYLLNGALEEGKYCDTFISYYEGGNPGVKWKMSSIQMSRDVEEDEL